MIATDDLEEERRKMRLLRLIIDLTTAILRQGNPSFPEAIELMNATKKSVLQLFPDKQDVYNLIYRPRFERIIREKLEAN